MYHGKDHIFRKVIETILVAICLFFQFETICFVNVYWRIFLQSGTCGALLVILISYFIGCYNGDTYGKMVNLYFLAMGSFLVTFCSALFYQEFKNYDAISHEIDHSTQHKSYDTRNNLKMKTVLFLATGIVFFVDAIFTFFDKSRAQPEQNPYPAAAISDENTA